MLSFHFHVRIAAREPPHDFLAVTPRTVRSSNAVTESAFVQSPRGPADEVAAADVARGGAARVEDLRVAKSIGRSKQTRQHLGQLGAQEARGTEAVRLEHRDDALGAGLRSGQRGGDLRPVVRA